MLVVDPGRGTEVVDTPGEFVNVVELLLPENVRENSEYDAQEADDVDEQFTAHRHAAV